MSGAHLSRSPAFNESFSPRSERSRPPRRSRTTYLVARAPAGYLVSRSATTSMYGCGSIAPRYRTVPSSGGARSRDRVAPIMLVSPSMEVARYKPKFRRDGARDTPRTTIACPVSEEDLVPPSILRSQRTTAGMGPRLCVPSPHPDGRVSAASGWSLLSFWHWLWKPTGPPTCPPLPCRGFSLGLRHRSQGPRANMDRVVLKARSQSQAFRARSSTSTKPTSLRTE